MCKNSGFRSRIQKSYKKFGIESKNLIIFSESIPNLEPICPLWLTQIAQISQAFFVGGKSHGCSPLLCFLGLTRIQRDSTRRLFVEICGGLWVEKISATKYLCDSWNLWFLKPRHKLAQIFTNYLWAKWSVSQ